MVKAKKEAPKKEAKKAKEKDMKWYKSPMEVEKELTDKLDGSLAKKEVEIQVKYGGFLHREQIWLRELKNLDRIKIPPMDFSVVPSLSREAVEKLKKFKPKTLGEALKISGMTPAAILNIYTFMKKKRSEKVAAKKREEKK